MTFLRLEDPKLLATYMTPMRVSLSSLWLRLLPHEGVLYKLPRWFKLLLSSQPGLLLFHFQHHTSLLLLLFNPLVITPLSLCLCIFHLRLLFFSFLLLQRFHLYDGLLRWLNWDTLLRLWTSCGTLITTSLFHWLLHRLQPLLLQ